MEGAHGPGLCQCHQQLQDTDPFGEDLLPFVDIDQVICLNEKTIGSCKHILRTKDNKLEREPICESNDGFGELLIYIPFTSPVRLNSFCIIGGGEGFSPTKLRVFKDHQNFDFNDAESFQPTQEIELFDNPTGEIEYATRVSKFYNTTCMWLHFNNNQNLHNIALSYIGMKGSCSGARRQAVLTVYEQRPMASDHKTKEEFSNTSIIR